MRRRATHVLRSNGPITTEKEGSYGSAEFFGLTHFILQEGNNLPPRASLDLCALVHETGKRKGLIPRP